MHDLNEGETQHDAEKESHNETTWNKKSQSRT